MVTGSDGEEKSYAIPYGYRIRVDEGDTVIAGDALTEGSVNPHDVLAVKGEQAVQNYLITEVQKVYRMQGVDINDKHIEVIVRQMMRKVRVDDAGDTNLLPGTLVERSEIAQMNQEIQARIDAGEKDLQVCHLYSRCCWVSPRLLWPPTASCPQPPSRRPPGCSPKRPSRARSDPLLGLKENVIIGKLVPAGTGMSCYRDVEVVPTKTELGEASSN